MAVNTPQNFCSSSNKAQTEARWIRCCINVYPLTGTLCTVYYSSPLYLWKIGSYLRFWKMGRICFSSLGLERLLDWTTFTGMFPATCSGSQLGFLQEFSKEVQVSQWYSLVAHSVWSSPMVEMSDHVLPISTADMWSLWVGRYMHTLVTYIA